MSKGLRGEEEWLRQCIEAATPGSRVTQHDDGSSNSMYDLDIFVAGERVGAVEISAAVDPQALELWRLVTSPGQWTHPGLAGGWMVSLARTAQARTLKRELPALLRALESQGVRRLDDQAYGAAAVEREYAESLGIESAYQNPTDHAGSVYLQVNPLPAQRGGGAPATADPVAEWISQWLRRDDQRDNLAKLARSGATQRHMAVLVASVSPAPFAVNYALIDDEVALPTVAPDLPDELTHCWVLSTGAPGEGWCGRPRGGPGSTNSNRDLEPTHSEAIGGRRGRSPTDFRVSSQAQKAAQWCRADQTERGTSTSENGVSVSSEPNLCS